MVLALFSSGAAVVMLVSLGMICFHYWGRVYPHDEARNQWEFAGWTLRSLATPLGLWVLVNTGWIPGIPPMLLARGPQTPGTLGWLSTLPDNLGPSVLVVSSYWAAATFLHLYAVTIERVENPADRRNIPAFWAVVTLPISVAVLYVAGLPGLGFAMLLALLPITHGLLSAAAPVRHVPLYSRAIGRMKLGKYADAEQEVLAELEKCADDFDGWMLLAELYASHFHDLAEAEATIRELCEQPNTSALQLSLAYHRLADWHLKLADDPAGARHALRSIIDRFPGTHAAHMAQVRIDQLPASRDALRHRKESQPIRLSALRDPLDDDTATGPVLDRRAAAHQANQWADRLRENPNDVAARERFARLLAEDLGKTELAVEQVNLLLAMPDVPPSKIAEWLALQAAWQLRHGQDREAAQRLLTRIVREFPDSPQAFPAQRRLNLLRSLAGGEKGRLDCRP